MASVNDGNLLKGSLAHRLYEEFFNAHPKIGGIDTHATGPWIDQRTKQLLWRQEVKKIADAARANNQSADDIRNLGKNSADQLLAHFPKATSRNLDGQLLNAIEQAIDGIDTGHCAANQKFAGM